MRFSPIAFLALALVCLLPAFALALDLPEPHYTTSTVDVLYQHQLPPVTLAEVTEVHGCALEPAYLNISPSDNKMTVRVTYLYANGTESVVFEKDYDPLAFPSGISYTYAIPREGEYALTILYYNQLNKRRTFIVDCTYNASAYVPQPPAVPPSTPPAQPPAQPPSTNVSGNATVPPVQPPATNVSGNASLPPGQTFEDETAAFNAIGNAAYTIDVTRNEGADVTPAQQKLDQARSAYASENYKEALSLAQEATALAEKARMPVNQTSNVSGGGFQLPSIQLPSIDLSGISAGLSGIVSALLSNILLIVGVIVVAAAAFFLLQRKKREKESQPPPEKPMSGEQLPSSRRSREEVDAELGSEEKAGEEEAPSSEGGEAPQGGEEQKEGGESYGRPESEDNAPQTHAP
ncbi:Uncharacterised protein [Candidatus Burarchaeum australiense]|nr:Uncharacterised protein [Candidatus Burarchaeum australiense]